MMRNKLSEVAIVLVPFLSLVCTRISEADLIIESNSAAPVLIGNVIADFNSPGFLGGTGQINGDVTVNNGGTIAPGFSPGTLTVFGDLTIDASTVTIELGGTLPGEFDLLQVTGAVSLINTPTIAIQPFGGFTPSAGNSFVFFTAGSGLNSGAVAFDFSAVGGAANWTTQRSDTAMKVTYVPEPNSFLLLGLLAVAGGAIRRFRDWRNTDPR